VKAKEVTMGHSTQTPWAETIMLGEARFGILEGGPFDGRCYPLLSGTPRILDVPDGSGVARYVLRDGRYRFTHRRAQEVPAA
jgi:hypothetical protein